MAKPKLYEFDATGRDDFISIMERVFTPDSAARKAAAWDWLFQKTDISGARTIGRGTIKDGTVVGSCLVLPYTLWIEGEARHSWWPVAVGVDPDHRGAGLPIVRSFFNNGPYYGGMPANDDIAQLYRRLGMKGEVALTNYFAPLRPGTILSRRKGLPGALGAVLNAGWGAMRSALALLRPGLGRGAQISEVREIGAEFDDLWQRAAPGYRLMLARDAAYLRWRFQEFPIHRYTMLGLWRGDQLSGYVALRIDEQSDRRNGLIVDIFTESGDHAAYAHLLAAAQKALLAQGAELAILQLPDTAWPVKQLWKLGFWMHKPMTLLQLFSYDPDENARMGALHQHWYFTRADSDQDY